MTGAFRFVNGIGTVDFTGVMLLKYGQLDVALGTYAPRDVYQPVLDWMIAREHTDITVAQAYDMIYSGSYPNLVIMDVRGATSPPESYPENYNNGHIRGAINVPVLPPSPFDFTAVYAWINSTVGQSHKNDDIIVNCRSGTRGNLTSAILSANGFIKVYNILGGYQAWVAAGTPP